MNRPLPTRTRSRGRRVLFGVLAIAVSLSLVFAMLEVALRIVYADSLDFSMEMWKYATQLKQTVDDPKLSFAHIPGRRAHLMGVDVQINSLGLRDREYTRDKAANTFRILLLGDSTTFGWGVRAEDTVAKLLEADLNAARGPGAPTFEVLNCGVGNYTTVQEVAFYDRVGHTLQPDLVILQFFINDAEPVPRENKGLFMERLYAAAFLSSRLDVTLRSTGARPGWKSYYASLYDEGRPGWEAAQEALRRLARETRHRGTRLLVTLLPELREINGRYPFTVAHDKVKAVLRAEAVPTLELIEGLKNQGPEATLWVTPLDSHPNRKANLLVAKQVRHWIDQNPVSQGLR